MDSEGKKRSVERGQQSCFQRDSDSTADSLRQNLALLNPYSVEVRYPGDAWMPSPEDAIEARQAAQEISDWIYSKLGRLF